MWELFTTGLIGPAYNGIKDLYAFARGRRRRLTPVQVLELRQKWKKEVEPILWERSEQKLGMDVIVRDMKRLDEYPDSKDEKPGRISSWFKVGLSSTYHNGIEVNLGWHGLVKGEEGWRLPKKGEEDQQTVALVATIPYERIEKFDWTGDTYYSNSQVYCHFEGKRGVPYDKMFFGTLQQNTGGPMFYLKVAEMAEVEKNSKQAGTWWRQTKSLLSGFAFLRPKEEKRERVTPTINVPMPQGPDASTEVRLVPGPSRASLAEDAEAIARRINVLGGKFPLMMPDHPNYAAVGKKSNEVADDYFMREYREDIATDAQKIIGRAKSRKLLDQNDTPYLMYNAVARRGVEEIGRVLLRIAENERSGTIEPLMALRDAARTAYEKVETTRFGEFVREQYEDPDKRLEYMMRSMLTLRPRLTFFAAQPPSSVPRPIQDEALEHLQPVAGTSDLRETGTTSPKYQNVSTSRPEIDRYIAFAKEVANSL